jgi:hypothetical protein
MIACTIAYSFNKNRKALLSCAWIQMFILMGLRSSSVGQDTYKYWLKFRSLQYISWNDLLKNKEFFKFPGWYVANKILVDTTKCSADFYMVSSALVISTLTVYIIYHAKVNYGMAYFIFYFLFFLQSMNVTREYIAINLVYIAYIKIKENKYLVAILIEVLAISVHSLSVVGIFILVVPLIKWTSKKIWGVFWIALILSVTTEQVMNLFISMFTAYEGYIGNAESSRGLNAIVYVIELIAIGSCWKIQKVSNNRPDDRKESNELVVLSLVACTLGIIFARDVFMTRIVLFFHFSIVLVVPQIITYKNRWRQVLFLIICSIAIANYMYRVWGNYGSIVPYESWLIH